MKLYPKDDDGCFYRMFASTVICFAAFALFMLAIPSFYPRSEFITDARIAMQNPDSFLAIVGDDSKPTNEIKMFHFVAGQDGNVKILVDVPQSRPNWIHVTYGGYTPGQAVQNAEIHLHSKKEIELAGIMPSR